MIELFLIAVAAAAVVAALSILVVRYILLRPLMRLVTAVRKMRRGEPSDIRLNIPFISPLVREMASEISKMHQSLTNARDAASEEARLRLNKLDTPWTAERLKEFIKAFLKGRPIYLVSNREPYVHEKRGNQIVWKVPPSGMVTALEPVMEACEGTWLAQASGSADRETADAEGKVQVPPDEPRYTLKRLWLTDEEINGFYTGFSNEALWPLCHIAHTRPIFRKEDWEMYKKVNGIFAKNLLDEIRNTHQPIVLVQDFHFALLPKMIKTARPDAQIGIFWHIPWPSAESFSICPWRKEILEGMLGADIVGFHTQQYCNNFMDTVGKEIESLVDLEKFSIQREGHESFIKPFPISIGFTGAQVPSDADKGAAMLPKLGIKTEFVGLGVDRLDYTKGILERLRGVEMFFERNPQYLERFTFLQIAPPSRETVPKYREYDEAVTQEAIRINTKFGRGAWQPVIFEKKPYTHAELSGLYAIANLCLVTSLHDGMNLVAKEYVASREDESGVLILSQFTGAARDMKGALDVNPYNAEEVSDAIKNGLEMSRTEQRRRMRTMRESVRDYNVYRWSADLLKAVASV